MTNEARDLTLITDAVLELQRKTPEHVLRTLLAQLSASCLDGQQWDEVAQMLNDMDINCDE